MGPSLAPQADQLREEWTRWLRALDPAAHGALEAGVAAAGLPGGPSDARAESALGKKLAAGLVARLLAGCESDDDRRVDSSVSHSFGQVVAAACRVPRASRIAGIGLDLEPAARPVSEAARKRIVRPEEASFGLKPIEFWTVKEACYKAFPASAGTVVPDYVVTAFDAATKAGQVRYGESGRFDFRILTPGGRWVLAFAACIE